MNFFLRHFTLLFLSFNLLIIFLFLIKGLESKSSLYYDKSQKKILTYSSIDYSFFGHSQSLAGINQFLIEDLTGSKVQNFSRPGAPLFYTVKRIENFLIKNKQAKIILELGTNQVDEKGMIRNLLESKSAEENFIRFLTNNASLLSLKELYFFLKIDFIKTIIACTKSIYTPMNIFIGYQSNENLLSSAFENIDETEKHINAVKTIEEQHIQLELNLLFKLLTDFPERDFLIIRIPEHPKHLSLFDNEENYSKVVNRLSDFKNVSFKDYSSFDLDNESYRDFNHLSSKGMNIFSTHLLIQNPIFFKNTD